MENPKPKPSPCAPGQHHPSDVADHIPGRTGELVQLHEHILERVEESAAC